MKKNKEMDKPKIDKRIQIIDISSLFYRKTSSECLLFWGVEQIEVRDKQ